MTLFRERTRFAIPPVMAPLFSRMIRGFPQSMPFPREIPSGMLVAVCVVIAALLGPGCTVHSSYDASEYGPAGIHIEAETVGGNMIEGEVLALVSDTLVVRRTGRSGPEATPLVRIPLAGLESATFRETSSLSLSSSYWAPTARWREELRVRSRYPHGLSANLRSRLLRTYGQSTLPTVQ